MKQKKSCEIISQEEISSGIFSMILEAPKMAEEAKPGQFVDLYCHDASRLLPRPISLCGIDREDGTLRLVYRVSGKGTKELSRYRKGDRIEVLGPLGNGFPLEEAVHKRVLLVGGGIGVPPMLETAKALLGKTEFTSVLGYRDDPFLLEDFQKYGPVVVATEDGSIGTKGTVLDAIHAWQLDAEVIFACGPKPMLRALKTYAEEHHIVLWVSMEERMACGIGACLACVCQTTKKDEHSQVNNRRVCKDGPVFLASEVEL